MKAIQYDRFGPLDVLHLAEVPPPEPRNGEVVVAVAASAINVLDSRVRKGLMGPLVKKRFPKVPGADLSGLVVAIGPEVRGLAPGDAVFGATDPFLGGAFAERVAVPALQLARKPAALSDVVAATLPIAGLAALIALRDLGRVGAGDQVLIHGASGAVGLFAVQIARRLGAQITAVTGTGGMDAVRRHGAQRVIDYRREDGGRFDSLFDVILNASGQMPFGKGRAFLKPGGRLIEPSPTIPIFIGSRIANLFRTRKHLMLQTFPRRSDLELLAGWAAEGALSVPVAATFPLAEARAAFAAMEAGGIVGKIVVTVGDARGDHPSD